MGSSTQMAVSLVWSLKALSVSTGYTSEAIDITKANSMALHVTALTGTTPDVTFTYTLSNSIDGTYTAPASPVTIGANISTVDVLDFSPEAASYMKLIATNNSGANIATLTAQLAVQET